MPPLLTTFAARWIFPVDGTPLENGSITIEGGTIVAVNKTGTRAADLDLGNVAILPGLVNAHTHLDLSDAWGECPPGPDFVGWLRSVVAHRRRQTCDDIADAIDIGLSQCVRFGTTLVGDIAAGGESWDRLASAPLRAVAFYEMLGLSDQRARQTMQEARVWLEQHADTETCRAGLSPHAPYSVRASLWTGLDREVLLPYARQGRLIPVALHLAETQAELQLLSRHQGPFVPFLEELGAWDETGISELRHFLAPPEQPMRRLFIHGNYLPPATDLGGGTLVYCPRTHAAFGHKAHPFRAFLAKGDRVALGTDSLASNPDLDVLAEARFLRQQYPELPGARLLKMATLDGAAALGWDDVTGSLTPGKSADLVVLTLPDRERVDPYSLILDSSMPISAMMFRGKVVYSVDGGLGIN